MHQRGLCLCCYSYRPPKKTLVPIWFQELLTDACHFLCQSQFSPHPSELFSAGPRPGLGGGQQPGRNTCLLSCISCNYQQWGWSRFQTAPSCCSPVRRCADAWWRSPLGAWCGRGSQAPTGNRNYKVVFWNLLKKNMKQISLYVTC